MLTRAVLATALLSACSAPSGPDEGISVLRHHRSPTRDGVYTDPALSKMAARSLRRETSFAPMIQGPSYAQPLYLDGGPSGRDLIFSATEKDLVYAFDARTGAMVWQRSLGTPVPLKMLPCGNIDPLGITGTPVIDLASRTLLVDAMTTPDGGATKRHLIFALSVDDGSVRAGWPVDVNVRVPGFDSTVQNQRGALLVVNGRVYVPYGGHAGDCGNYHGWVVGVSLSDPTDVQAWSTRVREGGIWAPGGPASDGQNIYVTTGNTDTQAASPWSDGEAIIRLAQGPTFSRQAMDYFAPTDWQALDVADADISGSGPILLDLPGAHPDKLVVALGKNGKAYLLDRANLGGINDGLVNAHVASNEIINAAAAYTTAQGTYVVFKGNGLSCPAGQSGDLTAIRISATSPPTITTAWCARQVGNGSPMVTTTDGHAEAVVWSVGCEGDQTLHGFDGDTGAVVYDGRAMDGTLTPVARFQTPIAAKGRIFVQANDQIHAFSVN